MGLTNRIRQGIERKATTLATFSTDTYSEYLRYGYYGLYDALTRSGGYSSVLGERINEVKALSLTAFFAGVKIISEDVGSTPLLTKRDTAKGEVEATAHSLYARLRYAPNPDMTAMQFRESLTAHAIMFGRGYARKEFSRSDPTRIIALWPLMPYETRKTADNSGKTVFVHEPAKGPAKTYASNEIFQLNGFGLTGEDGLNLLQYARNALGLALAQEEYAGRFFSEDQTPNIVLMHPGRVTPQGIEMIKEKWSESGKGLEGAHRVRVLAENMDLKQLHPDAQQAQLVEQRTYQLLEVCRLLRMPPHKLAELGRATWANIGDENQSYYTGTLRPWFIRWEESLKLHCFGIDSPYKVEHDASELVRGDYKTQTEGIGKLLEKGVLSVNEARATLNFNPIDGGDEHFIQLNMGTLQEVASGATSQPGMARVGGGN